MLRSVSFSKIHNLSPNASPAIIQGSSKLVLGRERVGTTGGAEIDVQAGDVVVVPAGVSHRSLTADGGYRYIGVYPEVRTNSLSCATFH